MMICEKCGRSWDQTSAQQNDGRCLSQCKGALKQVEVDLQLEADLDKLPRPVAKLIQECLVSVERKDDSWRTICLQIDCLEFMVKYCAYIMIVQLLSERDQGDELEDNKKSIIQAIERPSSGDWVRLCRYLSRELLGMKGEETSFARMFLRPGRKPRETELYKKINGDEKNKGFAKIRNDTRGHGLTKGHSDYLSEIKQLGEIINTFAAELTSAHTDELLLVSQQPEAGRESWMGVKDIEDKAATSAVFPKSDCEFRLVSDDSDLKLFPFIISRMSESGKRQFCVYDSMDRRGKKVTVIDYDKKDKIDDPDYFLALRDRLGHSAIDSAAGKFKKEKAREYRPTDFTALIEMHVNFVGRQFVHESIQQHINAHKTGIILITGQPGRGKTALACNLIQWLGDTYHSKPLYYFYSQTFGTRKPADCLATMYSRVLEESRETSKVVLDQNDLRGSINELSALLRRTAPEDSEASAPRFLIIDGWDEASAGEGISDFAETFPVNLPPQTYLVLTGRSSTLSSIRAVMNLPISLHIDLENVEYRQDHLRDTLGYLEHAASEIDALEKADADDRQELINKVLSLCNGNFLYLQSICSQLSHLSPGQADVFLKELENAGSLGEFAVQHYRVFWDRMLRRCSQKDKLLVHQVAATLVSARTAVTREWICGSVGIDTVVCDYALGILNDFLSVIDTANDESAYRYYHSSFREFVKSELNADCVKASKKTARSCMSWMYGDDEFLSEYALRFAVAHNIQAGIQDRKVWLSFATIKYIEQKISIASVHSLVADYDHLLNHLEEHQINCEPFGLIHLGLLRNISSIHRYPECIFQELYNWLNWSTGGYESGPSLEASTQPSRGSSSEDEVASKSFNYLELAARWQKDMVDEGRSDVWLRALTPPADISLTSLKAKIQAHVGTVTAMCSTLNEKYILSASLDGMIKLWDWRIGECVDSIECSFYGLVRAAESDRIIGLSKQGSIYVLRCEGGRIEEIDLSIEPLFDERSRYIATDPEGKYLAVGTSTGRVVLFDSNGLNPKLELAHTDTEFKEIDSLVISSDASRIIFSAKETDYFNIYSWQWENNLLKQIYDGESSCAEGVQLAASLDSQYLAVYQIDSSGPGYCFFLVPMKYIIATESNSELGEEWYEESFDRFGNNEGGCEQCEGIIFTPDSSRAVLAMNTPTHLASGYYKVENVKDTTGYSGRNVYADSVNLCTIGNDIIAFGLRDGGIEIVDLSIKPAEGKNDDYPKPRSSLEFEARYSPDQQYAAFRSYGGDAVELWDIEAGECVSSISLNRAHLSVEDWHVHLNMPLFTQNGNLVVEDTNGYGEVYSPQNLQPDISFTSSKMLILDSPEISEGYWDDLNNALSHSAGTLIRRSSDPKEPIWKIPSPYKTSKTNSLTGETSAVPIEIEMLAVSDSHDLIAVLYANGCLRVYKVSDGSEVCDLDCIVETETYNHRRTLGARYLSFTPNGQSIWVGRRPTSPEIRGVEMLSEEKSHYPALTESDLQEFSLLQCWSLDSGRVVETRRIPGYGPDYAAWLDPRPLTRATLNNNGVELYSHDGTRLTVVSGYFESLWSNSKRDRLVLYDIADMRFHIFAVEQIETL